MSEINTSNLESKQNTSNLDKILEQEQRLRVEKEVEIKKAFESNNVDQILKATQYIASTKPEKSNMKAIFMDPYDPGTALGYKDKAQSISYDLLRGMARTHIVKAIVETRKDQVAAFCEPQVDKYSTGFIVRKKDKNYWLPNKKAEKEDEAKIVKITNFILNCGNLDNKWEGDTFDSFVRKIIADSLVLDAATFEISRTRGGELSQFRAVDGATIRIAATYDDKDFEFKEAIARDGKSYRPAYVQVIDGKPITQFYPWELCYGIRNPSTALDSNGYGRSELEDMIQTITAILNSDNYNANFFKVGSAPKGILTYTGTLNENSLSEFREQWMAQTAGVYGMHKTPIINADKMNFINTHIPNKDMEFEKFQEFLIKIICAIYKMDPSEIGFPMSGNATPGALSGEGNNETKIKYSRDKGLKPLLKQLQYWINHYIVSELDPDYEMVFTGISGETTFEQELDNNIKMVQNFKTLNELRKMYDLKPIPGGDIVLNPIAFQQLMAQQQKEMQQNAQSDPNPFNGDGSDEENPFDKSEFFKQNLQDTVREIFARA